MLSKVWLMSFFEDTYIGRLRPSGHRRAPLFDLALWNMYDRTIGGLVGFLARGVFVQGVFVWGFFVLIPSRKWVCKYNIV